MQTNNNTGLNVNELAEAFDGVPADIEPIGYAKAVPPEHLVAFPRANKVWLMPEGGYHPLGYVGSTLYVWSNRTASVEALTPSRLSKRHDMLAVCGPVWVHTMYDHTNQKNETHTRYDDLTEDLIDLCHAAGLYSPSTVRGPGVWPENGALVVNSREVWRPDGEAVFRTGGNYVYAAGRDLGLDADTAAASPADLAAVRDALKSWTFARPSDRTMLLGWVASAVVPGAMDRRPNVILTGRRGSGKTTLQHLIADLLGNVALSADGASTAAGIRQAVGQSAMALLIDEAEASGAGSHRTAQIVEMLRSAYSDEAGMLRGTADQAGRTYAQKMTGLLSQIMPPEMTPADRTRFLIVDVAPLTSAAAMAPHALVADREQARALGARFRALVLERFPTFTAAYPAVRAALMRSGDSARAADTIGTVVAWAWSLANAEAPSAEQAAALVASLDLSVNREAQDASDELNALERLLDARANRDGESVANLIIEALGATKLISKRLERLGLRTMLDHAGRYMLAVASSPNHPGLRDLYKGSPWETGGWSTILRRMDGAVRDKIYIDERTRDAVLVPIPKDLLVSAGKHVACVQQALTGLEEVAA